MSVDLSWEFMDIKLRNPFLIASVPAASAVGFSKAAKAGWAGGVLWGGQTFSSRNRDLYDSPRAGLV